MSHLIASQKVVKHYLTALLTEDEPEVVKPALTEERRAELTRLLSQATPLPPVAKVVEQPVVAPSPVIPVTPVAKVPATPPVTVAAPVPEILAEKTKVTAERTQRFQALFFSVAGLKIAVPLTELGGIHELGEINTLFGKPGWFKGVMLYRQQKINVVDTARWVMPEKYDAVQARGLNYQYIIMLDESNWGLCCEALIDTITLEPEQVKWREHEGKRPWMAGLIKEHMCVLVDVKELVNMLNRGLDINA